MGNLINISEIIEFAIYIEKNGYKFYVESIKNIKDQPLVELFQYLADEEFKHEELFKSLLKKTGNFTPAESYPGEYDTYMKDFLKTHALANEETLKQKIASIASVKDAISVALDFEKDSIVLFTMLRHYIEPQNRDMVDKIIQEEVSHIYKINRLRQGR